MAKSLSAEQFPFTGPYALAGSGKKAKGPTAEALKRAMSRLGKLPWREFDQHYNRDLEAALDAWDPGGQNGYGDGRWEKIRVARVPKALPHGGELALDDYAIKLVQDEAGSTGTTDEEKVQAGITEWWEVATAHAGLWHYDNTFRPGDKILRPDPAKGGISDCSLSIIYAHRWGAIKSGLAVPDPAKQNWTGFGNTDRLMIYWPQIFSPFRVGDLMHFARPRHVIECIAAGTVVTAVWGSNGREAAPEILQLGRYSRFPRDFMIAVRPELLA